MQHLPRILLPAILAVVLPVAGSRLALAQHDPATPMPTASTSPVELLWESEDNPDHPLDEPTQLAMDLEGNLWIAEGESSQFQIFAPDGTFLEAWGVPGSAEGQFNFLDGSWGPLGAVAFDSVGNLYVVDSGNDRIQKFDPDRVFITAWGSQGNDDGQFSHLFDIAIDAMDRVYVIDDHRDDVQVFDSDGNHLSTFAEQGLDPGQLNNTGGLAIAADGTVWIADYGNNWVQTFTPDGEFLTLVGGPGTAEGQFIGPIDVAIDEHGHVYVVESDNYRVQIFDRDGRYLTRFGSYGTGRGEFAGPAGIAIDDDGQIYVSDVGDNRIQAFRLRPPLAPAVATPIPKASPLATGSVIIEHLGTVTLPAEGLPNPPAYFDAWTMSHFPGSNLSFPSYAPQVSAGAEIVLEGEYSTQSAGPMHVVSDGHIAEAAPGTEVTIGPGDAVVYVDYSAEQSIRNPGDVLTRTLSMAVYEVEEPLTIGVGAVGSEDWDRSGLAHGDVVIAAERLTLPPGASLPPYTPDVTKPRVFIVEDGVVEWAIVEQGAANLKESTLYSRGQTIWFTSLEEDARLSLRNSRDSPAVLLQVTLSTRQSAATPVATPNS